MSLSAFLSIEEKQEKFCGRHTIISSETELKDLLDKYSDANGKFVFRGVNDSSFRLYNSGQRTWLTQGLFDKFSAYNSWMQLQIDTLKKIHNGLILKWHEGLGIEPNDLSLLSFLQHYGAPTPLLDFSFNIKKALFFGVDNVNYVKKTVLDDYISLYVLENTSNQDADDYLRWLGWELNSCIVEAYENGELNNVDIHDTFSNLHYCVFSKLDVFVSPGFINDIQLDTYFVDPQNLWKGLEESKSAKNTIIRSNKQNLNVLNQEGLFVFSSYPDKPLEEALSNHKNFNLICYDISKELVSSITKLLQQGVPINRETIYPTQKSIAQEAFHMTLN